jgi:transcriptional regulator with XRE-family HTH domain
MLAELLRAAIQSGGLSRYAISQRTGVDQGSLSKFVKGKCGLSFESADRILDCLGLTVELRPRTTRKGE